MTNQITCIPGLISAFEGVLHNVGLQDAKKPTQVHQLLFIALRQGIVL